MGKKTGDGLFVCGLIKKESSIKIDEGYKVIKKHVEEGVFTLSGAILKAWTETGYKDGKGGVLILFHGKVVTGSIIKLSASFWFATIANSCCSGAGGECLGVENASMMEVEVLV